MPIPRTRKKPGRKKTRRTENLLHLFAALLRRNLLIYGVGGLIAPFPGIWAIDQLLRLLRLA